MLDHEALVVLEVDALELGVRQLVEVRAGRLRLGAMRLVQRLAEGIVARLGHFALGVERGEDAARRLFEQLDNLQSGAGWKVTTRLGTCLLGPVQSRIFDGEG